MKNEKKNRKIQAPPPQKRKKNLNNWWCATHEKRKEKNIYGKESGNYSNRNKALEETLKINEKLQRGENHGNSNMKKERNIYNKKENK